ncbi:hypothetical protein ABID21_003661 [Pseudorhizobium tarimense]|uniref:Uncharacterized protein n=1 Tax=Pseudorhizobium tarimense TaxID=1079109 RepID=A0ABV2HAH9_9HYPH|nr:hypothetical protein [Pseudorhizobium tarimense]MCJ8520475.1 hypothetical protein [Pseudorhizobium tarimense]
MNKYAGYAHQLRRGWWAMVRFVKDAKPRPILGEKGEPVVYETELDALRAVNKHLLQFLNFPIVGGECEHVPKISEARKAKAEKLLRGGGAVDVERVGQSL